MLRKYIFSCLILFIFNMSFIKGADFVTSIDAPIFSDILDSKNNLLEIDEFYQSTLPKILGENFTPQGEYKISFFAYPNHFHPFSNDPLVSSLWELCSGSLSQLKVGQYETMSPCLAKTIVEEVKGNQVLYHVTLDENAFWCDVDLEQFGFKDVDVAHFQKTPVTSADFKLYIDSIKNPYVDLPKAVSLRGRYQNLKTIEIIDSKQFTVVWEFDKQAPYGTKYLTGQLKPIPAHVFEYWPNGKKIVSESYQDKSNYIFAKHFCNHWAKNLIFSCGPWILQSHNHNRIDLVRNPDFHLSYSALMDKMTFIRKSSPIGAWQAFKSSELSSCNLSPLQYRDLKLFMEKDSSSDVKIMEYFSKIYYFIGWNQKSPLFQSKKVREALTLAINCDEIIQHFLKGRAQKLSGPFMPNSSAYDQQCAPLSYDVQKAVDLLEQEGWHQNKVLGVREKIADGKSLALRFHLSYFLNNELAQSICQYVSTSLKEIGVECLLQGLDYTEFMDRYKNKNFDAMYMAWSLAPPPENPQQSWHSSEADKVASSNIISFKDEEVDRLIEKLKFCNEAQARQELYHKVHRRIHELQPYTFLYVPKQIFAYRDSLQNVCIPKETPNLFSNASVEEPCPKIFYMKSIDFQ